MAKKVNRWYNCKCAYTAPYICSYCTNIGKTPQWLSILLDGKMVEINDKGKIRRERR